MTESILAVTVIFTIWWLMKGKPKDQGPFPVTNHQPRDITIDHDNTQYLPGPNHSVARVIKPHFVN